MRMTRKLVREGADLKVWGLFFKAVVQAVFIFGAETWVQTSQMGTWAGSSTGLRNGSPEGSRRGRGWKYPLLAAAIEEAGFKEIGVYITRRQNTVAQYIVTQQILDLCE